MEQSEVPNDGPYLSYAVLCEKVLHERDNVMSLIRIVDRITTQVVGPGLLEEMPPIPVNLMLAIALKAGSARGRGTVRVRIIEPSGLQSGEELQLPVLFEGEERGVSLGVNVALVARTEGIYWFEVRLGDSGRVLTRVPLRILYQPIGTGS